MTDPLVTIAMPFYNCERTLAVAIQSVLDQTYRNFELIVSDDGSTDKSASIVRAFNDPRIKLLTHKDRARLAVRLNECIDNARGEYFARMDADDISYPDRIEKEVRFLQSHADIDLVGTQMLVFQAEGDPIGKIQGPTHHRDLVSRALLGIRVWHATWCGKRAWFQTHRYDPRCALAQDQELLFRAHKVSSYAVIPELLYGNRVDALRLKKMLWYRVLWMRYMNWHLRGFGGFVKRLGLAGLLLGKALVDTFAMTTGLQYKILRHRANPLSASEIQCWERIRHKFFEPGATVLKTNA
jgi:glycosyltransferase involved in cell wall biosynthesis